MACDRCEECRENGYRFCIKCGENLTYQGPAPEPEQTDGRRRFDYKGANYTVIPSMITVVVALIAIIVLIIPYLSPVMADLATKSSNLYLYFGFDVVLAKLTGGALQLYWLVIAALAIAAILLVFIDSKDCFRFSSGYMERASKTPLFWLSLLLGSTIFLELIVTFMLSASGSSIEIPEWITKMTNLELIYALTRAGVYEEIAFRMVNFGVPMMIAAIILKKKDFWKYPFGGFGVTKLGIVFMIISTLIFAFAHVDGWGSWKFVSILIGSFGLAYLYMRFGIHVSMAAHLITDLMSMFLVLNQTFGLIMEIAILGFGFLCLPILFMKTIDGLRNMKRLPNAVVPKEEDQED